MPFKIVQTLEQGTPQLSIVPAQWENMGQLYWPPNNIKNRSRLVRDDTSEPGANWLKLNCRVKRMDVSTYKAAEAELRIMMDQTDTDHESLHPVEPQRAYESQEINFDDMAKKLTSNTITNPSTSNNTINEATSDTPVVQLLSIDSLDQVLVNQNVILDKLSSMCQTHNIILENQKKIALKLASLSVQLDDSSMRVIEKIEQPVSVTMLKDANQEEKESFTLKPIENETQLEQFEMTLSNKAERLKLRNCLSFLCNSIEGSGVTCCYKLLDYLMTREFLCKCSWSGGSRGEPKVPLKKFKVFLKFFYDMVYSWDPTFTVEGVETFFKMVLKNALKRNLMKNLRASTKRSRKAVSTGPKRKKSKNIVSTKNTEEIEETNQNSNTYEKESNETNTEEIEETNQNSNTYEKESNETNRNINTDEEESLC